MEYERPVADGWEECKVKNRSDGPIGWTDVAKRMVGTDGLVQGFAFSGVTR